MNLTKSDFLAFWNGRPKVEKLRWIECPIYVFSFGAKIHEFVHVNPSNYSPINWRGLL